jgi:hypothetical protein
MGYTYANFQIRNVDSLGNNLLTPKPLTIAPFTPTIVQNASIGNRLILSFNLNRFAGDNFNNKKIRVNISPFSGNDLSSALDFGFESVGFIDGVLTEGIFVGSSSPFSNPLTERNLKARFQRVSNTTAFIEIEFYLTADVAKFIGTGGGNVSTLARFLKCILNQPDLVNSGGSAYQQQKEFGLKSRVFNNNTGFIENVVNQVNGDPVIKIPFETRWYNSYLLGVTKDCRFLKRLEVTTPNQLAANAPLAAQVTATNPAPLGTNLDSSFVVSANQLEVGAKNSVFIQFDGLFNPSVSPNPATTDIRVLLLRVNPVSNTTDFITDLDLKDSVIPFNQPAVGQLDGAIFTPSSWADIGVNQTNLQFVIDGAFLQLGETYRILVNIYDSANDETTTHLTPELVANYTPPITPTIDGFISTYNQEFDGNDLSGIAPHSRFKSRLVIDKVAYNSQLAALGLSGSFDSALTLIKAILSSTGLGDAEQIEEFKPNTLTPPLNNEIITAGFVVVSDMATEINVEAYFRADEEKAGQSVEVRWFVEFDQPTVQNNANVVIQFFQDVTIEPFENDEAAPVLISAKVYDAALYPTNKVEVFDICDKAEVVVEVEKDSALLSGSVNFAATIYPADEFGNTSINSIEEQEDWAPAVVQLPLLTSPKLEDVDIAFAGDFAAFKVNVLQLTQNQRFWITALAYEQFPDYCPIGLVQNTQIETFQDANPFSGWVVIADKSLVTAEIVADADYVGGINTVYQRIVDSAGNIVGFPTSVGDIFRSVRINPLLGSVFVEWRVEAQFDKGSGPHTVAHTFVFEVPQPLVGAGSTFYNNNTYQCADLG